MINETENMSEICKSMENITILEQQKIDEINELNFDTKKINEGVILDRSNREHGKICRKSPFTYSESYIDEFGNYIPKQIKSVYREDLKRSEVNRMLDYLRVWRHQENGMSCAAACSSMEIQVKLGKEISEKELCKVGEENGWYNPVLGTYSQEIGKFVDYEGLNSKHYSKELTLADLNELNKNGVGLMVCVDSIILDRPDLEKPCTANHVVEIIGFDDSNPEHPLVIINDPGTMHGRGAAYELEHFERAAGAHTTGGKIKNVATVY